MTRWNLSLAFSLLMALSLSGLGCGKLKSQLSEGGVPDSSVDHDASRDTSLGEPTPDRMDTRPDMAETGDAHDANDARPDGGTDADAHPDAHPDATETGDAPGGETSGEAGTDVPVTEGGTDVAIEAGADVAIEAGADVAAEAGAEVATEAGAEAGTEGGPADAEDAPAEAGGCDLPMKICGGVCIDPNTDNNNCGTCNDVCPFGTGCVNGICR